MKSNIQLNLSDQERKKLRQHKIKKSQLLDYALDELEVILEVSPARAKEIYALADFQRIPSIGIKFAEDLIFLKYYSISELSGKDGAELTDEYERQKGYRIDSCVEDQFRLAVFFAETNDHSKRWWDFTNERKKFRTAHGYPDDRPQMEWHQVLK